MIEQEKLASLNLRLDTEKRVKLGSESRVQLLVFPPIGTNHKDYTKILANRKKLHSLCQIHAAP